MSDSRVEHMVGLLTRHQEELFRHIFALLPHEADARDVLQETCIALFRKAEDYDPERPFVGWACGFAKMEVLKHRARARKSLLLEPELIEVLSRERESRQTSLQKRLTALDKCLELLPTGERELVRSRYDGLQSVDQLLQTTQASRRTLMRRFERIRRMLFNCVSQRLLAEE